MALFAIFNVYFYVDFWYLFVCVFYTFVGNSCNGASNAKLL